MARMTDALLVLAALATACGTDHTTASSDAGPDVAADRFVAEDSSSAEAAAEAASAEDASPEAGEASDASDAGIAHSPEAGADAAPDASAGLCEGGAVCPIDLLTIVQVHPGLKITWKEEQPCDTVEGEEEYGLIPYPSQQTPPGPPTFTVPGSTTSWSDPTDTGTNMYVYHARCIVGGVPSVWSNELANNGSVAPEGGVSNDQ